MKELKFEIGGETKVVRVGDKVELQDILKSESDEQFVEQLLESGCLSPDNENVLEFKVLRRYSNVWLTDLEITDIY